MTTTSKRSATADATSLLEIVMTALQAKSRIPQVAPRTDYPSGIERDALLAFIIEEINGGYVANVVFDMAPGEPNMIRTLDAHPLPTYRDAFLAGAAIVCEIVTGSRKLPFFFAGDKLMVVTVTSDGRPFIMQRPIPTHC